MTIKQPAKPIKDKATVLDMQDYLKYRNTRDYILFILGISTGYRAGDLVALKVRDIREALKRGYFVILEGKKAHSKNIRKENMKPRTVKVIANLRALLSQYICGMKDYEYVFQSRKGNNKPITVSHVSRILSQAGQEFGLQNISAHSMRKTFAYQIYVESGFNLALVREMLGHRSDQETKVYIGLDRDTYDKISDTLNTLIRV